MNTLFYKVFIYLVFIKLYKAINPFKLSNICKIKFEI